MSDTAVVLNDFSTVKELAQHIKFLDSNATAYTHYMRYKFEGVTNPYLLDQVHRREYSSIGQPGQNLFKAFTCYLCKNVHSATSSSNQKSAKGLGCPPPRSFPTDGSEALRSLTFDDWLAQEYLYRQYQVDAFRHFYDKKLNWTYMDLYNYLTPKVIKDYPKQRWLRMFKSYALRNAY